MKTQIYVRTVHEIETIYVVDSNTIEQLTDTEREIAGRLYSGYDEAEAMEIAHKAEAECDYRLIVKLTEKCQRCKTAEADEPHICPYQDDVNSDTEYRCNCCSDCYSDCTQEI